MRVSHLIGETLKEVPADVEIVSHQLLLRAGYIRQLATGVFSYLPLAWRSLRKVEQILREEMDAIDGQEMNMPVVHPAELWQQTGRYEVIGDAMVRFTDRAKRPMLLAMTHEEVVAALAKSEIKTYRQLPALVYQMQTKFRDEPRARGGLIRVREFVMKDSYSLDRDETGLKLQYQRHYDAYHRIFARAGLEVIAVSSDTGMMGGKVAHEFMFLAPIGEDTLALCPQCGYSANREVARFQKTVIDNGPPKPIEEVHTPATTSIDDLAKLLGCAPEQTAKVVFYVGKFGSDDPLKLILAIVRGDMEVNQTQVQNLAKANEVRPAHAEEITAVGCVAGFASAIGIDRSKAIVIVDDVVAQSTNLIAGANKTDYHLRNVNVGRDFKPDVVGHIACVYDGAGCPTCGKPLELSRGVEVGNIFQLGTKYTDALGAAFTDEAGKRQPIVMGSYGIGVGRLFACVAEKHRDDAGLNWPIAIAPFAVQLVAFAKEPATQQAAETLYKDLQAAGIEVLFDDRDVSPGFKFADADLRGMPIRVVVSDRSLKNQSIELKLRRDKSAQPVPLADALPQIRKLMGQLEQEMNEQLANAPTWKE